MLQTYDPHTSNDMTTDKKQLETGPDGHRLSVIVPTLNEALCVGAVLDGLLETGGFEELLIQFLLSAR